MFAVVYLVLMILVGDLLSRRFCNFVSPIHRWATAFLVGLLLSSWTTYLAARLFASNARPLMLGNLVFFVAAGATVYFLRRRNGNKALEQQGSPEDAKENKRDWIVTIAFAIFVLWMMFSTFNMKAGNLQIGNHEWSDFGPNIALMQSFAIGNNFPTEYPHFAGDRIRYHFLFYFQAGNLEYLGLNPALSNNLLSTLSLVSMLMLVMTLGFLVFRSRAVGRIAAALFFFHGSLAYVPFLRSQGSIDKAIRAVTGLTTFLPSGFPYRGEDWGMWSLVNFLNQRHFASAIGVFLLTVCFLLERYTSARKSENAVASSDNLAEPGTIDTNVRKDVFTQLKSLVHSHSGFIFVGGLVGLLPMWNGAVFIASLAVLVTFLVFFPLRRQLLLLLITAAIVALPQLIYLRTGDVRPAEYSVFHWGYTITNPTILNVLKYLGYTFGLKWFFIAVAIVGMSWFQRRLLLAFMSLLAVAFLFQFSEEVLANHKFLNIWLIVANAFVAFGIWQLWTITVKRVPVRLATIGLVLLVILGGVIDLFPIHRSYYAEVPFEGDPLLRWTRENTDPRAIFLSDRFVTHQILLAGRRIFFGWPYYSWGTGYKTNEREAVYRQLFQEKDPSRLTRLLKENNISYVAIDDGLRRGDFITNLNEAVYENHFEKVFHDSEHRYGDLSIFKVAGASSAPGETSLATVSADVTNLPAVNAFQGGRGMARGQFASARGLAADSEGSIYVADTGNSRIQKFSAQGEFVATIGGAGNGMGQLRDPVGVAVDSDGSLYVSDSGIHKLVKFGSDGRFVAQWAGPPPGFYGPLDVALGPQGYVYVVDQGRARIVVMDKSGNTLKEWGKKGSGDGEFDDPTGIAVGGDRVYVADLRNNRIQAFDLEGKFLCKWQIPSWRQQVFHNPDVLFDAQARRVYVSSGATNEVLVFDPDGKALGLKKSATSAKFERPSGLALSDSKGAKRLYVMNTDGANLSWVDLGTADPNKEVVHSASATLGSRNH